MRIILVGHGHGATMHFTRADVGSGWENLCTVLDGNWYSLDEAATIEADMVLYIGTVSSVVELAKRGKPACWRKTVLLQEGGNSTVNDPPLISAVQRVNFDGFLAYSCLEEYEVFGKPVIRIYNAYPFDKFPELRAVPKDPNLLLLNVLHLDPAANTLGTLHLMQLLPECIKAICFSAYVDFTTAAVAHAGLAGRIEVRAPVSWHDYVHVLAGCKAVASMDGRRTWGRQDLDAALVGIRCIGPATATKLVLFPECVAHGSIAQAAAMVLAELSRPQYELQAAQQYFFSYECALACVQRMAARLLT